MKSTPVSCGYGVEEFSMWSTQLRAAIVVIGAVLFSGAVQAGLIVKDYQLVEQTRVTGSIYDYRYRVSVQNTGSAGLNISATADVAGAFVFALDDDLYFGDVAPGATVASSDTFVLRVDSSEPWLQMSLDWTFSFARPLTSNGAADLPEYEQDALQPEADQESSWFSWADWWVAQPAPTLRAMTYNIRHGEGTDGVQNLDRLGAVIASQQPDLVAIQEIDYKTLRSFGVDQAEMLAAVAGMPYFLFGRAIDFRGGEYGVAILSRYPFSLSGNVPLPVTDGAEARTALWVQVAVPEIGDVLFVATHLDGQDRVNQSARLLTLFGDVPTTPAGTVLPNNVILAGDFNANAGSAAIELLGAEFNNAFVGGDSATFPADAPTKVYDWVFVSPRARLTPVQSWVLEEVNASDHRPVVVDFELN